MIFTLYYLKLNRIIINKIIVLKFISTNKIINFIKLKNNNYFYNYKYN